MYSEANSRRIFVGLIALAILLVVLVIRPLAEALIFATVLASALMPLQEKLSEKLRGRRSLCASVLTVAVLLLILVPLASLGAFALNESIKGVRFVVTILQGGGMTSLLERLPDSVREIVENVIQTLALDESKVDAEIKRSARAHGGQVAAWVSGAVAATGTALMHTALMLIAFFFLLIDGRALVRWIEDNSPLREGQFQELLLEARRVSGSILFSSVATAGVQAAAALVGYLVAGVPHPAFFCLVTFFLAFVPAIGAGGVCVAASVLLLAMGNVWQAIFLAAWGMIVVGLSDNLVKPLLVKRGVHMHGGVVFFSLIGGLWAFGAVGLLLGPLVVTFLVSVLRIYKRDFGMQEDRRGQDEVPAP